MTDHPITPPPELVGQWIPAGWDCSPNTFTTLLMRIADNAALWSHDQCRYKIKAAADQELKACCDWLRARGSSYALALATARRPKPPSLKEQALEALSAIEKTAAAPVPTSKESLALIRQALEALINE
jgi:hypothetical protein